MIDAKVVKRHFSPKRVAIVTARRQRECAQFLIELSEIDPRALRPGDISNLCSELMGFGLTGAMLRDSRLSLQTMVAEVEKNPSRVLGPLIEQAKKLLAAIADGESIDLPLPWGCSLTFNGQSLKMLERLGYEGGLGWRMHAGSTTTLTLAVRRNRLRDQLAMFLFHAARQLDSAAGIMIRRCLRQSCRRIYLANRPKQTSCSRRCVALAAEERYRADVGEDNYRADHARAALESYHRRKRQRALADDRPAAKVAKLPLDRPKL